MSNKDKCIPFRPVLESEVSVQDGRKLDRWQSKVSGYVDLEGWL